MSGCLDDETIVGCVEGLLSAATHAEALAHIDGCERCHALLVAATRALVPAGDDGLIAGRYRLRERLGAGAMGEVFAAEDQQLRRRIAIKLLRAEHSSDSASGARLQAEAQALARVQHPNVVHVYETGVVDDRLFVAMELVEGGTLSTWLAKPARSPREIAATFAAVGRGLGAVHAAGLVHRDFKPDNVLMGEDGRPRITDFGLARFADEEMPPILDGPVDAPLVTQTGAILGTPAFMSPEQLRAEPASSASDQFSFCVALYRALYGAWPFGGRTVHERLDAIVRTRPKPLSRRGLPRALRQAVLRGLLPTPAARHPSMSALVTAIERALKSPLRRYAMVATVALISVVALVTHRLGTMRQAACANAQLRLNGVWDADRRSSVSAAFARTGLSYAAAVLHAVDEALDRYSARWGRVYTDVCLVQDRQPQVAAVELRCLDRRRGELDALVRLLTSADPTVIKSASDAADKLSSLEECNDPSALAARLPRHRDPATTKQIEALEGRLDEFRMTTAAGRYAPALAGVPQLLAAAQKLGDRLLEAEIELELGGLYQRNGDFAKSEQQLNAAALAAEAAGDDRLRADVLARLVSLVGARMHRFADAQVLARRAGAVVERLAGEPRAKAELFYNEGLLAGAEGNYAVEEQQFRQGLALLHQAEPAPAFEANLTHFLGMALYDLDRQPEALELVRAGLRLRTTIYGPMHPEVAFSHSAMAVVLVELGRPQEAKLEAEQALVILETFLGAEHPDVANTLEVLGDINAALGDNAAAEQDYRRELAIDEKTFGPNSANVCNALVGLGQALRRRQRYDEAQGLLERALAIREKALGADHPELGSPLSELAVLFEAKGDFATALRYAERDLAITRTVGLPYPEAQAEVHVGYALFRLGRVERGEAALKRAVEALSPRGEKDLDLAEARFYLAQAHWPRDHASAVDLAEQAERTYLDAKRIREQLAVHKWLQEHSR